MQEKRGGPGTSTGAVEEFPDNKTSEQTAYSGEGPALVKYAPENLPATMSAVAAQPETKTRRSGLISRQIAILLFGSDADGRVFTEEAHTVVLSLHGAGIVSRQRLIPEQELVLRWVEKRREAEVRVVGEIAQQGGLHTYGVAFVSEGLDFWEMEFPEAAGWLGRPESFLLECGGCHELEELTKGDFEYDICTIHGRLTRYCRECGLLTVWRKSERTKPVTQPKVEKKHDTEEERAYAAETIEPVKVEDFLLPIAEPATTKEVERRARVRAKVSFFARVRSQAFGEEVVPCIDMARGGMSFRTQNCYEKEARVQIAVPYRADVREAPAIFVKGRVANMRKTGEGMWRCGVEFVRDK